MLVNRTELAEEGGVFVESVFWLNYLNCQLIYLHRLLFMSFRKHPWVYIVI